LHVGHKTNKGGGSTWNTNKGKKLTFYFFTTTRYEPKARTSSATTSLRQLGVTLGTPTKAKN